MTTQQQQQGFVAEVARAGVHAVAWFMLVWPLARTEAALAAFLAGFFGCFIGSQLGRSRLRLPALLGAALFSLAAVFAIRQLVMGAPFFGALLGPAAALRLGEAGFAGLVALIVSAAIRTASTRRPVAALFEVVLVALAFAQLFVAHRDGAINRPFTVSDPIIALGGDPTVAFLIAGGIATAVAVLLLMKERRVGRGLLHFAVVLFLLALIVQTTQKIGLPPPPSSSGGLGLRPGDNQEDKGQGQDARGQPGERRGRGDRTRQRGRPDDDLQFRDDYDPEGAPVPIAVVIFHDDYSPPSGYYYFRQGAFSQYNGRRLVSANRADVDRDLIDSFPSVEAVKVEDAPETNEHRMLLETTVAMMADHNRPFALESPVEVAPLINPDPNRFRRVYEATSGVLTADYISMFGSAAGSSEWSEAQWEHYTDAPEDARYRELTEAILEPLPPVAAEDPIARAFAIADWLGAEGIYSLKNKHSQAEDPTASFLFGDLTGYCVHFSHAAAYLMRSAGLPARVANGYAIDEASRQGGSALLLSGSYSHAWPEVYLEGYGWVVVDVAPQQSLVPPPEPNDRDLQRLMGELVRGEKPTTPLAVDLPALKKKAEKWGATLFEISLFTIGVILVFLSIVKFWRRAVPRFASSQQLPRVLYRADLDRMSELALRRERGESREGFARRVHTDLPSIVPLTESHLAAAFGQHEIPPEALRERSAALQNELEGEFTWWRRWLGIITPWSWLRTR